MLFSFHKCYTFLLITPLSSLLFYWPCVKQTFLQNESEAILKIKESMQEEAKRFEKGSDGPSDFFMP